MPLDQIPAGTIPLPLLMLDGDARIVRANLKAQEALGRSSRQLTGQHLSEVFGPESEVKRMLSRFDERTDAVTDHAICDRRNGTPYSLHIGLQDNGMTAVFVPEGNRAEAQEHARRHVLAETVARIALEMAHEVKNPLASLRGAAQWLSEQPVEGDIRETTIHILGEVDRIRDRIDAFLQVGPRASIQMEPTNLHALIHDVEHPLPDIQIKHVFDPSLPEIIAHPARLRQALENLWNNAVDAATTYIEWQTRMAPTVRLPDHRGAVVELRITNDGAPIPEELRERLFEPYVTGKQRGSGLGLALVERVMLEHGGRVSLISELGRTTFVLHLPVRRDPEQDESMKRSQ